MATPFFDKVMHNLTTEKKNKTSNQCSIEIICALDALWQTLITFPDFREPGRSLFLSLEQLKLISKNVGHLLLEG